MFLQYAFVSGVHDAAMSEPKKYEGFLSLRRREVRGHDGASRKGLRVQLLHLFARGLAARVRKGRYVQGPATATTPSRTTSSTRRRRTTSSARRAACARTRAAPTRTACPRSRSTCGASRASTPRRCRSRRSTARACSLRFEVAGLTRSAAATVSDERGRALSSKLDGDDDRPRDHSDAAMVREPALRGLLRLYTAREVVEQRGTIRDRLHRRARGRRPPSTRACASSSPRRSASRRSAPTRPARRSR